MRGQCFLRVRGQSPELNPLANPLDFIGVNNMSFSDGDRMVFVFHPTNIVTVT